MLNSFTFLQEKPSSVSQKKRWKKPLPVARWTAYVSGICFLFVLTLKITYPYFDSNKTIARQPASLDKAKTIFLPSFVANFKSSQGLRMSKVSVDLKIIDKKFKRFTSLEKKRINNHILFLLTGKDAKNVTENKEKFESDIKDHLNAFLSQNLIRKVNLKTEFLN